MTAKKLALRSYLGSVILLLVAILFYRGGNFSNQTLHFQWTTNFLSDLGLTKIHNATQPYVRAAFAGSLFLLAVAIVSVVEHWRQFVTTPLKRLTGRLLATLAGLEILTVAVVPADSNLTIHQAALVLLVLFAAGLWLWVLQNELKHSRVQQALILITTIALVAYVIFLVVAPRPGVSLLASQLQAQVEKSIFLLFLLNFGALLVE